MPFEFETAESSTSEVECAKKQAEAATAGHWRHERAERPADDM